MRPSVQTMATGARARDCSQSAYAPVRAVPRQSRSGAQGVAL